MKTLNQLIQLEGIFHETGLLGDELQAEFVRRQSIEDRPLSPKAADIKIKTMLKRYFTDIYETIDGSRRNRGAEGLGTFEEWMGEDLIHCTIK